MKVAALPHGAVFALLAGSAARTGDTSAEPPPVACTPASIGKMLETMGVPGASDMATTFRRVDAA